MTMFRILLSSWRIFLLNARTPGLKRVFSVCDLEFRVPKAELTPPWLGIVSAHRTDLERLLALGILVGFSM